MIYLPAVIIGVAGLIVAVVNLAYFRRRLAWRGAALVVTGTLLAAGGSADRAWWLACLGVVPLAWGLLVLMMPPPDPADLTARMVDAFAEWAKREGMPTGPAEAKTFMSGYVKGRADLREEKGVRP